MQLWSLSTGSLMIEANPKRARIFVEFFLIILHYELISQP